MTRLLLTGANGQLGFELKRALAPLGEVIACTRQQMDLAQERGILDTLNTVRPDIIINPAAYTAVDQAENEPEQAQAINHHALAIMANWAAKHKVRLVHYSTDYVFDGSKNTAYTEDDPANPQSVYGLSKWLGEEAIRAAHPQHLILRTSWVFGAHGNNFLKTILRLAQQRDSLSVVADQIGSPTSAALIADVSAEIIRNHLLNSSTAYGTYHLTAQGTSSWYHYAQYVVSQAIAKGFALQLSANAIQPIPSAQYPLPAKRPNNSQLNCSKLIKQFSMELPAWQRGVEQVLDQLRTVDDGKTDR
ncbi:dTDP-4-dehydrorhamnose reductase [Neisseriaceae bacterium TC5R-5]|nr:dTDP-4-dehydrorhamnose reductase [Neisseriaceae bacterium TC5R-5]